MTRQMPDDFLEFLAALTNRGAILNEIAIVVGLRTSGVEIEIEIRFGFIVCDLFDRDQDLAEFTALCLWALRVVAKPSNECLKQRVTVRQLSGHRKFVA